MKEKAKGEKAAGPRKAGKPRKADKAGKAEGAEKAKRPKRPGKAGNAGTPERPERAAKPERPERPEKPEKTPEDLAAIAYLDRLRRGDGETVPLDLPLACVVRVVAYEEIPKANDRYALATVRGPGGREWKMCIPRYNLETGMNALFVSKDATMPEEDRYRNRDAARVKLRVYRFGFGTKVRRLLPIVNRSIYRFNCGLLYPLDEFPELADVPSGELCAERLDVSGADEMRARAAAPRPKASQVLTFAPGAKKVGVKGFLDRLRRR